MPARRRQLPRLGPIVIVQDRLRLADIRFAPSVNQNLDGIKHLLFFCGRLRAAGDRRAAKRCTHYECNAGQLPALTGQNFCPNFTPIVRG